MNNFLFVGFCFTKHPKDPKKFLQLTVYANSDETILCASEGLMVEKNFEKAEFGLGKFVEEKEILPFIKRRYACRVSIVKNVLETIPMNCGGNHNWLWARKTNKYWWY